MNTLYLSIIATVPSVLTSIMSIPVFGEEWQSSIITIGPSTNPDHPPHDIKIQYQILNGSGTFQVHDYTFTTNISSKTDGTFEVKIPRNLPYYNGKNGPSDVETYVVIENGVQLTQNEYVKTDSDCFFTYSIPYHMNSTITILSTYELFLMTPIYGDTIPDYCMSETMIPEFPNALPILVISIVSVILFYRIRLRK